MAALTLGDMLNQVRSRLDDTGTTGILWMYEDLTTYANNGEEEICRRALVLKDSSTVSVTQFTTVIAQESYALNDRVLFVQRAIVDGELNKLRRISMEKLDTIPGWSARNGTPAYFSTDFEDGQVLLNPIPDAAVAVDMVVFRLPLLSLAISADVPEIQDEYHSSIVDWMTYEAYSKNDADTDSVAKAAKYYDLFTSAIGMHQQAQKSMVSKRKYPKNIEYAYAEDPGSQVIRDNVTRNSQ